MSAPFYRAFEDRYRGSREDIKRRLTAYRPFLPPLAQALAPARALDLGCGRGEWLELLAESGYQAEGVDLDDGMLAACRARGLNVRTADAIATLREAADDSLALISAFHVVEHIPFEAVRELIVQALRVLRPGGLLILETPNPENLVVGSNTFYLDPSHERPLPPPLLAFAAEHAGFGRHLVVRLQEAPGLLETPRLNLQDVLGGASPDYAVVAQKDGPADVMAGFDAAFGAEYGLSLERLAQRYDSLSVQQLGRLDTAVGLGEQARQEIAALNDSLHHLQEHVSANIGSVTQLDADTKALRSRTDETDHRIGTALQALEQAAARQAAQAAEQTAAYAAAFAALEQRIAHAEAHAHGMAQQVLDMQRSRSWRMTAPLRRTGDLARSLRSALRGGGKVAPAQPRADDTPAAPPPPSPPSPPPPAAVELSPRTGAVYATLEQALKRKKDK
jgi:SAM-dependent methyltransferase